MVLAKQFLELVELFNIRFVCWSLSQLVLYGHYFRDLGLEVLPQFGTVIGFNVSFAASFEINWRTLSEIWGYHIFLVEN